MGYSGRYHAASLAAVFVALAIGILIGVGLAEDVVSSASQEVEDTLRADRDEAQEEADSLRAQLDTESAFGEQAGPALVAGRLARDRVALFALGDLPDDGTDEDVERALGAAGADDLEAVASIASPPDVAAIRDAAGGRFLPDRGVTAEQLGRTIGRQMVGGGPLVERIGSEMFTSFSGDIGAVNRAVLVSLPPDEMQADLSGEGRMFELALVAGIDAAADGTVGVERSSTDPTTLAIFSSAGVSTVDDIDRVSGQVSLVLALLGAEGDFGSKEAAGSLLPDLPSPATQTP